MNTTSTSLAVQPLLFSFEDLSGCFLTAPSYKEKEFMAYWNALVEIVPPSLLNERKRHTGRPGYALMDILAVWMVKDFFCLKSITDTLSYMTAYVNLRIITGISRIPSGSTVSRLTGELWTVLDISELADKVRAAFFSGRLICNLSIDSTTEDARAKPVNGKRTEVNAPKKRGRKKKGSEEALAEEERRRKEAELADLEENGDIDKYLSTLNMDCSLTGKKNSKGHMQWRIGYKVHMACDDNGIPVSHVVTGASVHDSQVAIPLLRKADSISDFCYALMDSGYFSSRIDAFTRTLGKIPVIDGKKCGNSPKPEMDPAKKQRYRARTTVERTNSELKECFLPKVIYSRGIRAHFEINLAVLLVTMKAMRRVLLKEQELSPAA